MMNIVYTFDNSYADITMVSIMSLIESNINEEICIYIIDYGISDSKKNQISRLIKEYGKDIVFLKCLDLSKIIKVNLKTNGWSLVCYERLFFSSIIPQYVDKVLHIDCDTLILSNLKQLYDTNIEDFYAAACYDCYPEPRRKIKFTDNSGYYSNGIILVNLNRWRRNNIEKRFIQCINEHNGNLPHLDQDVLNIVCRDSIYTLSACYNLMTPTVLYGDLTCDLFNKKEPFYKKKEIIQALNSPKMIHFTGVIYTRRPWEPICFHPYNNAWLHFFNILQSYGICKPLTKKKKKYGILNDIYCFTWIRLMKINVLKIIRFYLDYSRLCK